MSSAAKMVADSTQSDLPEKTTKKRKKEVTKKKVKKKKSTLKKGKKKASEDEFDEHDLDLENEVRPLGFFVKDREELMRQMFHCVQETSLQRALPDVLKELPLEDLQKRCLEHLVVMSKKRIRRIIAGDDPASISSSGTEDDTTEEEQEPEPDDLEDEAVVMEEDYEGQMVDSTSQYTGEMADSDREFDDQDEGSLGPSGQSPIYSDIEEYTTHEQDDEVNSDYYEESQDSIPDEGPAQPEIPVVVIDANYEPEEGEVTDDYQVRTEEEPADKTGTDVDKVDDESKEKVDEESKENNQNESKEKIEDESKEKVEDESKEKEEAGEADKQVKNEEKTDDDKPEDAAKENVDNEANDTDKAKEETGEVPEGTEETAAKGEEKEETQKPGPSRRVVLPPAEVIAPVLTKNQMELLELEMRARAIKAMLKTAK